jgi:hypothetical protein
LNIQENQEGIKTQKSSERADDLTAKYVRVIWDSPGVETL